MITYGEDKIKVYKSPFGSEVVKFEEMGVIPIVYLLEPKGEGLNTMDMEKARKYFSFKFYWSSWK